MFCTDYIILQTAFLVRIPAYFHYCLSHRPYFQTRDWNQLWRQVFTGQIMKKILFFCHKVD